MRPGEFDLPRLKQHRGQTLFHTPTASQPKKTAAIGDLAPPMEGKESNMVSVGLKVAQRQAGVDFGGDHDGL